MIPATVVWLLPPGRDRRAHAYQPGHPRALCGRTLPPGRPTPAAHCRACSTLTQGQA